MRTMYDGISVLAPGIAAAFPEVEMIARYLNGGYAWGEAQIGLFPAAEHVTISVTAAANEGDVLDVESGDATPDQTAGWIAMRKASGLYRPTIYCSRSVIPAVRIGTGPFILGKDYDIWVADYTGTAHQVTAPGLPAAVCAATQWQSTPRWDISTVYNPLWPCRQAPAAPGGISVTVHGPLADFGWGGDPGVESWQFQLFHHMFGRNYGHAVADEIITSDHLEQFRLPGGGKYAVRVRPANPVGEWTPWKIF